MAGENRMKKKDQWMLIAVLAVLAVGYMVYNPGALGTTQAGTADQPVTVSDNTATLSLACYDAELGIDNGKVGAQIEVQKGGVPVYPLTNDGDGVVTLDANQGFKEGDAITVRCLNNSDTGYYENRVQKTLTKGVNSVAVPVKKVGTVIPSVTSGTVAITAAGSGSMEYDLDITTQRQFFHNPVIGVRDQATNVNAAISSGNITSMTCTGGHTVPCDTDTAGGYVFCCQLDLAGEYLSTSTSVSDAKIFLYAGTAADPIGNLTATIFDSIPFGTVDGGLSINHANAYDTTNTALQDPIIVT